MDFNWKYPLHCYILKKFVNSVSGKKGFYGISVIRSAGENFL